MRVSPLKRLLPMLPLIVALGLIKGSGMLHTPLALSWQAHTISHQIAEGPDVIVGHH